MYRKHLAYAKCFLIGMFHKNQMDNRQVTYLSGSLLAGVKVGGKL